MTDTETRAADDLTLRLDGRSVIVTGPHRASDGALRNSSSRPGDRHRM